MIKPVEDTTSVTLELYTLPACRLIVDASTNRCKRTISKSVYFSRFSSSHSRRAAKLREFAQPQLSIDLRCIMSMISTGLLNLRNSHSLFDAKTRLIG
jgi:hypothetical protein